MTDYFHIAVAVRTDELVHQSQKVQNLHKRNYNEKAVKSFKQRLQEIDDPNEPFKHFFEIFQFTIIFS